MIGKYIIEILKKNPIKKKRLSKNKNKKPLISSEK